VPALESAPRGNGCRRVPIGRVIALHAGVPELILHLPDSTATDDERSALARQEHLTQPVPLVFPQRRHLVRLLGHVRSHCASPDRRLEVVELVAAMAAVLLRPGFVVEGIDRHDQFRAVTGGLDVDGRQVLVRLVAGHEVDQ